MIRYLILLLLFTRLGAFAQQTRNIKNANEFLQALQIPAERQAAVREALGHGQAEFVALLLNGKLSVEERQTRLKELVEEKRRKLRAVLSEREFLDYNRLSRDVPGPPNRNPNPQTRQTNR
jgi:hypothetical protein